MKSRGTFQKKIRPYLVDIFGERAGMTRYVLFSLGSLLCVLLAVVPLLWFIFVSEESELVILLCSLSSLGWFTVGMLLMRQRQIYASVREAIETIGLADSEGSLTEIIDLFSIETARFHRASYGIRTEDYSKEANLSNNLQKIVELAYKELPLSSVELSLFDEESNLWSQSLLMGEPTQYQSQSLLVDSMESSTREVIESNDIQVHTEPVHFAGSTFGVLRMEVVPEVVLTADDMQVVRLLSAQAGISLVNARFTEEVLRMRRLGDETMRAKTGFLANLSHELRGPLGIILNGVELASEGLCGEVSPPLLEMLRMIKDSGDHLLDLVNDVLDFAKVEAGKVKANPTDIPLKALLEDLCAVVRTQAFAKSHSLTLEQVDASLGVQVDKRHIRQMLINFLTNAIKYTPDGGEIRVYAEKLSDGRAKISVEDNGIGIEEDQREKVFGAFERVESSYALSQTGTGLGMPLTQRLAEVNKGAVGFESVPSEGSTFWLLLPSIEIEDTLVEESEDEQIQVKGAGDVILVVDHNEETRSMLVQYLSSQGFSVLDASSGQKVLQLLKENSVDLAIIENDLPDLPGEEVVSAIRSISSAIQMPIILLSARAFVFDIERFLKLGVDRCLSKPVSLAEVGLTSRRLIDQRRSLDEKVLH